VMVKRGSIALYSTISARGMVRGSLKKLAYRVFTTPRPPASGAERPNSNVKRTVTVVELKTAFGRQFPEAEQHGSYNGWWTR
jgi:hypothetical protein